ncbi:MAG TPA: Crp/Fnr family transcriptional regulator [Acidimicrobiales bacterium]|nr:Crp/Fnr family transcriptional regulator [Acidimicrobiales bacterium]
MQRVQVLLATYLFSDMTPASLEPLAAQARSRLYGPGEFVFREGDPAANLYVVASGQLKESWLSPDGDELVSEIFVTGAVFGEPGLFAPERNRVVDVVAMTRSELLVVPRQSLVDFATAHPPVLLRILEGLAAQVRSLTEELVGVAFRPIRERLSIKLLELATTHGEPDGDGVKVAMSLSQSSLASLIGASRENVNRTLQSLADTGAVVLQNGRIACLRPAELARHAAPSALYRRNRLAPGAVVDAPTYQ